MKVLVCGDRDWEDYHMIYSRLKKLPKGTIIIHGAARGADSLADRAAEVLGLERDPYPAEWDVYGRAAGPIRNKQMLDQKPDLVIAFHDDLRLSKGTANMVRISQRAQFCSVEVHAHGKEVTVYV